MSVPSRIGIDRPRHKHLMDTHHQLRESLRDAQQRSDAEQVVRALSEGYPQSPEGLNDLLRAARRDDPRRAAGRHADAHPVCGPHGPDVGRWSVP